MSGVLNARIGTLAKDLALTRTSPSVWDAVRTLVSIHVWARVGIGVTAPSLRRAAFEGMNR